MAAKNKNRKLARGKDRMNSFDSSHPRPVRIAPARLGVGRISIAGKPVTDHKAAKPAEAAPGEREMAATAKTVEVAPEEQLIPERERSGYDGDTAIKLYLREI